MWAEISNAARPMCFSAVASFTAAGVLAGTGVAANLSVKNKPHRLVALVPIFFAIQQAIEGFQWLAVKHGPPNLWLGYAFLFFAYLFWPVYIPAAAYAVEPNKRRWLAYKILIGIGTFTSATLIYALASHPLEISVHEHGLSYFVAGYFPYVTMIGYTLATMGAGLLSSRRYIKLFGILATVFSWYAAYAYTVAFASVWCFFAAVLSVILLLDLTWGEPQIVAKTKKR